jgi:phosphopantothenoylcysteine decarboxylase/phosphopantothenate--cysteine ligase
VKICVGIAGSIAAYRSVDFIKKLMETGHEVRCVLTAGGKEFVSARVLETVSGVPVLSAAPFDADHFSTDHISTARWAEAFLVFGATANFIGRLASGLADDFLNLQLMAFEGPVLIIPAMNPTMWRNPLLLKNVTLLKASGYRFVGPIFGKVACGEIGVGHIASDAEILQAVREIVFTQKGSSLVLPGLSGKRVLISAGPMRTQIDPVRMIQNRSSGKMGLALAEACQQAGAASIQVVLGLVSDAIVERYQACSSVTRYEGPSDYYQALEQCFASCDVFFSAAAVLDFEVLPWEKKIERNLIQTHQELSMRIKPVPDIVASFGRKKKTDQKVIAFAAESGTEAEILERAREKLVKKSVDAVIANPVWDGLGPDSDHNQIWILTPHQPVQALGPGPKSDLAWPILQALFGHS